ncbi:uncharacterized protein F5Z01DRAFT_538918 [Emericellopsis atlantica]|uniref:Uncharacterized protein n=1 Tax=Emericellopsis atlantica TaxID=2614577 RepID=A0A9P8CRF3_9HYPO|nr:uncharacterized protein F5Z01DRAFT_538918 [Emericellopsis atlantica]KAG9256110.1 hypothetical protein F5Z01DRAFT_538918 [Emericellopsis atlantica]
MTDEIYRERVPVNTGFTPTFSSIPEHNDHEVTGPPLLVGENVAQDDGGAAVSRPYLAAERMPEHTEGARDRERRPSNEFTPRDANCVPTPRDVGHIQTISTNSLSPLDRIINLRTWPPAEDPPAYDRYQAGSASHVTLHEHVEYAPSLRCTVENTEDYSNRREFIQARAAGTLIALAAERTKKHRREKRLHPWRSSWCWAKDTATNLMRRFGLGKAKNTFPGYTSDVSSWF